ncbi:MAG TPA: D-alanine--D-alanine ligase A, partial [Actinomycetes bacterium]
MTDQTADASGSDQQPRRARVAVVFGGRSTEHAVSCVSAGSVLAAVDRVRYDVVPVGISREGRWVLAADEQDRLAISGDRL